jgi:3-oxoacyl-[acyl-carrier protein] reductase
MTLAGKRAIVTGASRGIGRAIALAFARAGAELGLCALDAKTVDDTAQAARALGVRVVSAHCDVAIASEVEAFAARVMRELGVPDVVVHNAGVIERALVQETSEASWDHVLDVNLKGPFLLSRALLPAMRARRQGRFVFIGSIAATLGTPRHASYNASKHGLVGLARSLAEEVRDDGLQVSVINPGSVDTDMLKGSPYTPRMSADDIAGVALYLASSAPAALTGASIDVFG